MAKEAAPTPEPTYSNPLAAPEREVPDFEDCARVLVMNRRLGMFNGHHMIGLPPRQGEPERYKTVRVQLLPGLNLAPKEWIEALRKFNPSYESAFDPREGCLEMIGTSKDWAKVRQDDAIKMVTKTGSVEALEALAEAETREDVLDAIADELAERRKHNELREKVQREQRKAKRRKAGVSRFH